MRRRTVGILVVSGLFLLFAASEFLPALEAAAWHLQHGSRFTQDQMSLILPLSWSGDKPTVTSSISAWHNPPIPASLGTYLESVSVNIPKPCGKPVDFKTIIARRSTSALESGDQIVTTSTIQLAGQPAQCVISKSKLFPRLGLTMDCERSDGVEAWATTYKFPNPTIEEMLSTAEVPSCPQAVQQ